MDGFDDLLSSSRANPVLDNPFEDPFARPRSPDPWLTYTPALAQDELHTPSAEPTDVFQSYSQTEEMEPSKVEEEVAEETVDPLDAKAANAEEEEENADLRPPQPIASDVASSLHPSPVTSPLTSTPTAAHPSLPSPSQPEQPRKSESPVISKAESIEEPVKAPTPPPESPRSPPRSPETVSRSTTPPLPKEEPVTHAQTQQTPPTDAKPTPSVASPLDTHPPHGEPSFATLALGGEMPGWQSTPVAAPSHLGGNEGWGGSGGGWAAHENGEGFVNGSTPKAEETDDDDDVPIAHKVNALAAAAATSPSSKKSTDIQPTFIITVGDPQKVGDTVRPYILYTVTTRTTSPNYRRSTFSVLRRYSDFLWLYETLSMSNPGVIIPPVPEKQQYGRFEDTFVEQRRAALNKCIQKTANHPALRDDPDLKLFLESDTFALDIKQRKAELAHERGGLITTIGSTLIGPRFYETDEWFDHKKAYLDTMESQLRGLIKSIDLVSKQRNELAVAMGEFADQIFALSECDMSKQLSQTLGIMADIERKAKELQDLQARNDVAALMGTADEYARMINSVRLAFTTRVRSWTSWQNADSELRRVQQAHEKARRQGKIPPERLAGSLSEVGEAERRAIEAKQEFDNASKVIKTELARFEQERVEDFKNSLVAYLDGMISRQKEIIQAWEDYQESLLERLANPAAKPGAPPTAQPA